MIPTASATARFLLVTIDDGAVHALVGHDRQPLLLGDRPQVGVDEVRRTGGRPLVIDQRGRRAR